MKSHTRLGLMVIESILKMAQQSVKIIATRKENIILQIFSFPRYSHSMTILEYKSVYNVKLEEVTLSHIIKQMKTNDDPR